MTADSDAYLDLVTAYWRTEETRDVSRILEFYNSNARFTANGETLVGHDEISQFYSASCKAFPEMTVEIIGGFASGNRAAYEWRASIRDRHGAAYVFGGANIFTFRDGKFEEVRAFFDTEPLP